MDRLRPTRSWPAVATLFVALRCGGATADQPPAVPAAGTPQHTAASPTSARVLLLHDGGVLSGEISRSGDRFLLRRDGSEIEIAASKVSFAGGSMLEAYDHRRTQVLQPTPDADAHLSLADWCLRNNLLPQAARELLDARGVAPDHPRIALLERRLASAAAPRPPRPQPVRQATAEDALPLPNEPHDAELSIEELPSGAVERFTRKVQPILVNNCTAAGCHQLHGRQSFQLDRALLRGLANRRSTQRNLAATLALVDRSQPHLSPLLTVPRRAHGGRPAPVFGPRQAAAYSHLVDWVRLVTQREAEEEPAAAEAGVIETDAVDLVQGNSPRMTGDDGIAPDAAASLPPPGRSVPSVGRKPLKHPVRYGARLTPWQPNDEFDPEIFNRRQRASAAAVPAAAAPSDDAE